MRILVADDDPVSRLKLAAALVKSGHEVVEVEDGEAAWKVLQEQDAPKLALLDWIMPKMEGVDVVRKVRAVFRSDPIYLILITSRSSQQDRVQGLEAGADDYLTKPFDPVELRARIGAAARIVQLQMRLSQRVTQLQSALAARRQLQEALLKEEHHFHSLMDHLPDAIYFKDTSSRFTRVNRTQARRMGLADPSEVIGKTDSDFFTPAHAVPAFEDEQEIMRTGEPMVAKEEKETWPDGTVTWVVSSKMPLRQPNGETTGTFGISHDITRRKEVEEANRFLASIVEASTDAISGVNLDGTIATWNRGAELLYGYRAEEVKGKPISILIPPERSGEMAQIVKEYTLGKKVSHLDTVRLAKDGRRIDVSLTVFPMTDAQGQITGSAAIARDITASKGAEDELSLERSLLRTLIDTMPDNVFVKDTQGRVVIDNVAHRRLIGAHTQADVVGKTVFDYFPPEFASRYAADERAVLASGQPLINREEPTVDQKRNPRWLSTDKVPLRDQSGNTIGIVGVSHDITDRKRAAEELVFKTALLEAQSETTIDGILVVDVADHIVLANRQFGLNFGIPNELLGTRDDLVVRKYVMERVADPDAFVARVNYLNSHRNEKSRDELRFKDGKVFDRYSAPLVDSHGSYRGRIWYFRDITERKRIEEALRLTQFSVENALDAVLWTDPSGRFLYANEAACHLVGCTREELLSLSVSDVDVDVSWERWPAIWEALKARGSHLLESRMQTKQGKTVPVEVAGKYLRFGDQEYSFSFVRDITVRKRAEGALRTSEQRYRRFLERNAAGVIRNDLDGAILDCNDAILRMLGYDSAEEFKSHRMAEFYFDPRDRDTMLVLLRTEKLLVGYDFRFKRKDGTPVWLLGNMTLTEEGDRKVVEATVIDITERKRVEQELARERNLFDALMEHIPDTIYFQDTACRFVRINKAQAKMLGVTNPQDAIGKTDFDFFPADIAQGFFESEQKLMQSGKPIIGAIQKITKPDGEVRWLSATEVPIRDEHGRVIGFVGISRDITERTQAEAENQRLATAIEQTADGIVITDTKGSIQYVNPAFTTMAGYSANDMVGQNPRILKSGAQDAGFYQSMWNTVLSGNIWHGELINRRKNGTSYVEEMSIAPVRDGTGAITNFVAIKQDVTERKRAQEALSQERSLLRTLIDNLPDYVYVKDTEGRFMIANAGVARLIGVEEGQDLLGKSDFDFFPDELAAQYRRDEQEVIRSGQSMIEREETAVNASGNLRWHLTTKVPFRNAFGDIVGLVGIGRDITDRKQAEEELRRSEAYLAAGQRLSHTGSWALKPSSGELYWSEETFRIFGFDPTKIKRADLTGTFLTRIHPEDRARVEQGLKAAPNETKDHRVEYRIVLPDGSVKHIHDEVYPVTDETGKVIERYGVVVDVTERKRAEEALRKSEERTRLILDTALDAVITMDSEGVVVGWNVQAENMFGWSREEALGRRMSETIIPLQERDAHERGVRHFLATGEGPVLSKLVEVTALRRGGGEFPVEMALTPVKHGEAWTFTAFIRDLSERKRAEEGRRQSEEQFRQLAENIREVFFVSTPEPPRAIYVSPAYDEIWGRPRQEVYDRIEAWTEAIHPEDRQRAGSVFARSMQGVATDMEYRIVRPDGSLRWIRNRSFPVNDSAGKFYRVVGTAEDITERKQAEDQLRKLSRAVEQSSSSVVITDRQGNIEYVNPKFTQLTGYAPEEVIGKNPRFLKSGSTPAETYEELWKTLAGGGEWRGELVNKKKNGELYWEFASISPIRDSQGAVTHFIAVKEDITEHKRAEEALRESEFRFRRLAESNIIAVFTGGNNGCISDANDAFLRMLRYTRLDLDAGIIRWDCMTSAEYQHVNERIRAELISSGVSSLTEVEYVRKDGSRLPALVALASLDTSGAEAIGFVLDLTERKRLEVDLRQAQKLEAVGQLAAGIAHEINTPVQFVGDNVRFFQDSFRDLEKLLMSYGEMRRAAAGRVDAEVLAGVDEAERRADWEYLKAEVPKALEQTLDGVGRVSRIVRAMKDFSHVGRGGEKAAADLNRAIESTLVVARNELKYVADVETEFGEIAPVVCDLGDLNQVFLNLLVNAAHAIGDVVKGTGNKGKIRVRTWQEGEQAVVAISDTGGGIPEEIREKIFEPFFTTKEVGKGTGQGLTLARSVVVERHGGSLTLETEVGKGSTFFVRLPISGSSRGVRDSGVGTRELETGVR